MTRSPKTFTVFKNPPNGLNMLLIYHETFWVLFNHPDYLTSLIRQINFSKQVLKWRKGRWYWICQKSVTIVLGKDCLRKQHDSRIGEATKELRLSVDKKRKHILCRSRPQPPLLLPLVPYYGVVEQKNALCVRRRTYGVCVYPPGRGPFSSLVFLEKSTSNCSLWFVPKMCVHCKL